jgi:hypothetical protein
MQADALEPDMYSTLAPGRASHDWQTFPETARSQTVADHKILKRSSGPWRIFMELLGLVAIGVLIFFIASRFLSPKPKPEPILPENCERAGEETVTDRNGKTFYASVDYIIPQSGDRIRMVAVPKNKSTDPETFYIMVDKVTVAQYRRFAKDKGKTEPTVRWPTQDDLPVMGVKLQEAHAFASDWMKGHLPSIRQWDKAAGRFETNPREGPYVSGSWAKGKPGIGLDHTGNMGPVKVGAWVDDLSPFGCRDMSSNGFEWTETIPDAPEKRVGDKGLSEPYSVELRGQPFGKSKPLSFEELEQAPAATGNNDVQDDYGFRVVIECES